MVEKRAQYLKRHFERDPKYFQHYKNFMDAIISKGYAKSQMIHHKMEEQYLPHHGVYQPLKSKKICVVFDCSSDYRGKSINKELLAGLDLTIPIVGTLIKFRQDEVAYVADIERCFSGYM